MMVEQTELQRLDEALADFGDEFTTQNSQSELSKLKSELETLRGEKAKTEALARDVSKTARIGIGGALGIGSAMEQGASLEVWAAAVAELEREVDRLSGVQRELDKMVAEREAREVLPSGEHGLPSGFRDAVNTDAEFHFSWPQRFRILCGRPHHVSVSAATEWRPGRVVNRWARGGVPPLFRQKAVCAKGIERGS